MSNNPLFNDFSTVHGTAPFSLIKNEHFLPAFKRGIELAREELRSIRENPAEPDMENTIVAMERAGKFLSRVCGVFYPLASALSDDEKMKISIEAGVMLSKYTTDMLLDAKLWERIKHVHDTVCTDNLVPEDAMLLKNTYEHFARNGAMLKEDERNFFRKIRAELSTLTTKFAQNIVKELPRYELWLKEEDTSGLPDSLKEEAAIAAGNKGRAGEYLITLDQPCYVAFMKYSDRDDLREKLYGLYSGRNTDGEFSNMDILLRIAELRLELARLLGYDTYAEYSLVDTMAGNSENVRELFDRLVSAYSAPMRQEIAEIARFASDHENREVEITPWNYSYYAHKLKACKFNYDEESLRPYFSLDKVITGVFGLASALYGLKFTPADNIEVYHPDVKAYVVTDNDGSYLGILYADFFPREGKQPGAWMTEFKEQWHNADGTDSRPHISIVMNFTKPTDTKPSLLTPAEVGTFLHEFGHALHGLLSRVNYASLSGTNVYRDFVELPSQFNENYLTRREFLDTFASHYITGEPIPQQLVDSLVASRRFGVAYACMRQLYFGILDMAWHTITCTVNDVEDFERKVTAPVAIFAPVEGCMTSPQFSHIFSGGYAAGYYSYKWAEVLDADAFAVFEHEGVTNKSVAMRFRKEILEKGGSEHPESLYNRFKGGNATIDALLCRDGIECIKK